MQVQGLEGANYCADWVLLLPSGASAACCSRAAWSHSSGDITFHADVLKQYADIDIALDPFPFTGGLTSCESLWMGLPVITWPQSQVVSRQTFAFLSAIGLPELAAQDGDDYVRIAVALAADWTRLAALRSGLRSRMQASPLMDVAGFTRQLEQTLLGLYRDIEAQRPL